MARWVAEGPGANHLDQALRVDLAGADLETPPAFANQEPLIATLAGDLGEKRELVVDAEHARGEGGETRDAVMGPPVRLAADRVKNVAVVGQHQRWVPFAFSKGW